jgi:hypothetical protein
MDLRLAIGGVNFWLRSSSHHWKPGPDNSLSSFLSTDPADVQVHIHHGWRSVEAKCLAIVCDSNQWQVWEVPEGLAFTIHGHEPTGVPDRLMLLDRSCSNADVYLQIQGDASTYYPLEYPLGHMLLSTCLAARNGMAVHAAGVVVDGRAVLFIGKSGSGKTTMAGLWSRQPDVTVLADDLVVVRQHGDQFVAYGTPWHGTRGLCSPTSAPLERIYFVRHARLNQQVRLSADALLAARLYSGTFLPAWSREGLARHVEMVAHLAGHVPCYDLGFVPDISVVDYVREHWTET